MGTVKHIVVTSRPLVNRLVNMARPHYNLPKRKYHDWAHAQTVISSVREIATDGGYSPYELGILLIAAAWHDAVYVPGRKDDLNEKGSADLLENVVRLDASLHSLSIPAMEAAVLIRKTTLNWHLHPMPLWGNRLLSALLDADLRSLSLPYRKFYRLQRRVRMELDLASDAETCFKHGEFLKQFLSVRGCIYHTTYARSRWESLARSNIITWCQEHGVPV